jgi:hypothetical protein
MTLHPIPLKFLIYYFIFYQCTVLALLNSFYITNLNARERYTPDEHATLADLIRAHCDFHTSLIFPGVDQIDHPAPASHWSVLGHHAKQAFWREI